MKASIGTVALATFLTVVEAHTAHLVPADLHPYPAAGNTRFFVHTFDGLLSAEAAEEALGNNRLPFSAAFHAGHGVIAAIREAG